MRKAKGKYFAWSAELLEFKWNQVSAKRERLVNRISKYDVQMEEIKAAFKKVKPEVSKEHYGRKHYEEQKERMS
jgi:hypothetical protein